MADGEALRLGQAFEAAEQEKPTPTEAVRRAAEEKPQRHAEEHDERWRALRQFQAEIAGMPDLPRPDFADHDPATRTGAPSSGHRRRRLRRGGDPARRVRDGPVRRADRGARRRHLHGPGDRGDPCPEHGKRGKDAGPVRVAISHGVPGPPRRGHGNAGALSKGDDFAPTAVKRAPQHRAASHPAMAQIASRA
jgi:hypothetical protein